jgi:hypothetical protein
MRVGLHPRNDPQYLSKVCEVLPQPLAGFLAGLAATSSLIWSEGGLLIEEISDVAPTSITIDCSSPLPLIQEFFCCVCGNRSQERVFEAAPVVENFFAAIKLAFPGSSTLTNMEVDEGSWCYRLHTVIERSNQASLYMCLFWSVD